MGISWHDCRTIDPSELENRISTEDNLEFFSQVLSEEPSKESAFNLQKVRAVLSDLPEREADFVELYFFKHKTQTDIAEIFKVSQPTVCYRLHRATARIRYVLELPDIEDDELIDLITPILDKPEDVKIMYLMFKTTCQSAVAKELGVTQGKVRHRFIRSLKKIKNSNIPKTEVLSKIFDSVSANLNILREVERPAGPDKMRILID